MLFCFAVNGTLPFLIYRPDQYASVFLFAPVAGAYFGLFYAMQPVIFSNFIPVGEEAACYGLLSFSSVAIRWIPPLVYGAIVQASNDHRVAIMHVVVFYLMGALMMTTVDFDKGRNDVAVKGKTSKAWKLDKPFNSWLKHIVPLCPTTALAFVVVDVECNRFVETAFIR